MENKTRFEKICIGICIAVLGFFAVTIAVRFFTRQILIERLRWDNAITEFIWFDNPVVGAFGNNGEGAAVSIEIDWESLYPFKESNYANAISESEDKAENLILKKLSKIEDAVFGIEEKIERYSSALVVFCQNIIEASYSYEQLIGWNFASFGEYNGVVMLPDGYLTSYVEKRDTSAQYHALEQFNDYCQNNNMDFLYVTAPYKISQYDDNEISGSVDFSNQNADELMNRLTSAGIDNYDIRKTIHEEGLDHHSLFYRTDHHWLTTTGMWGAQKILEYCNNTYGWNVDTKKLDLDNFDIETYPEFFLGSQGKKVTLSRTAPDDFSLLYPKYKTLLHYVVYDFGVDTIGDYSVCYNMKSLGNKNYYSDDPYSVCNYGNNPMVEIENMLEAEDKKIAIIHDSFGSCLVSGLALGIKNVSSLDLRNFTGSVESYLEKTKPDLVIVMYHAGVVGADVDYSTHKCFFDFR